jgi:hypothetical protein
VPIAEDHPIAQHLAGGDDVNADSLQVAGDANAQNHPEDNPHPPKDIEPVQNIRANGVLPRICWLTEEVMPGDDRDTTVLMGMYFLLNSFETSNTLANTLSRGLSSFYPIDEYRSSVILTPPTMLFARVS